MVNKITLHNFHYWGESINWDISTVRRISEIENYISEKKGLLFLITGIDYLKWISFVKKRVKLKFKNYWGVYSYMKDYDATEEFNKLYKYSINSGVPKYLLITYWVLLNYYHNYKFYVEMN